MPYIRYFEETRYTEYDVADTIPFSTTGTTTKHAKHVAGY